MPPNRCVPLPFALVGTEVSSLRLINRRSAAGAQALTAQGHAAHYAAVERSTTEQLRAELAAARKQLVEAARYQVRARSHASCSRFRLSESRTSQYGY